jgi:hypothetical protein
MRHALIRSGPVTAGTREKGEGIGQAGPEKIKAWKRHRGGEGGRFQAYGLDSESGGGISSLSEEENTLPRQGFPPFFKPPIFFEKIQSRPTIGIAIS